MTDSYVALVHVPEQGSRWGVTFPDVLGCTSGGDTFEDAIAGAKEALTGHLAALRADREPVPPPRTLTELMASDPSIGRSNSRGYPLLVEARGVSGERVRVNIMMDKGVMRSADEVAEERGLTRSGLIEKALVSYLGL